MNKYINLIALFAIFIAGSCTDPDQVGNLDKSIRYIPSEYIVTSGAENLVPDLSGGVRSGKFEEGVSSLPLTFTIGDVTRYDLDEIGAIIPETKVDNPEEFFEEIEIIKYKTKKTVNSTEEEGDLAFDIINAPAVQIDKHRGFLIINNGNKLKVGKYFVDIKVTNVSGESTIVDALSFKVAGWNLIDWTGNTALGKPELIHEDNDINIVRMEFTQGGNPFSVDNVALVGNIGKRGGLPKGWRISEVGDNYFEFQNMTYPFDGSIEFNVEHGDAENPNKVQYYVHVSLSALGKYTLKMNFE